MEYSQELFHHRIGNGCHDRDRTSARAVCRKADLAEPARNLYTLLFFSIKPALGGKNIYLYSKSKNSHWGLRLLGKLRKFSDNCVSDPHSYCHVPGTEYDHPTRTLG